MTRTLQLIRGATLLATISLTLTTPMTAIAAESGPWQLRLGASLVDPKDDNGSLAGADASVSREAGPSLGVTYFLTANLAADLLLATPFRHDVSLNGNRIGDVEHLPPVLSLQYHFRPEARIRPYVGAGINYTFFMHERMPGGDNLKLDDSMGMALQAGVDVPLDQHLSMGLDVRHLDIDSKASLNGTNIGTARIDPLVWTLSASYRF